MDVNARWIWVDKEKESDEYILFYTHFQFRGKRAVIRLCAETNYLLKINGKVAGYGQFAGFSFEKYYDEIDVTNYCVQGENLLEITVWYEGYDSFTHIDDGAGLLFTVAVDGSLVASSGNTTLCALDCNYVQYARRIVTVQVGYTSSMVKDGGIRPLPIKTLSRNCRLKPRPVKKLVESPLVLGKLLPVEDKRIYDLGAETAGYAFLEVECESDCTVTLTYGEQLLTGEVSRIIPGGYKNVGRDFSMDFKCKRGKNVFTNYFLRLAGRYLQVYADASVKVEKVGLIPVYYPLTEKGITLSGLDKRIYDVAVRTLRLCMHEHYEDCPWREQALYSLDSRNQMLCGYYAFEESEFQRENLVLLSKGKRSDGLLELTCPAVDTPSIPFFSLIFPVAVYEYVTHTNDESLIDEVWDALSGIMQIFTERVESNGLIKNFPAPYWNFYEWTTGSDGNGEYLDKPHVERFDLILNCAFVYAYQRFKVLCERKGVCVNVDIERPKDAIKKFFYDKKKNRYFLSDVDKQSYSQLGNAFAVLIGLGDDELVVALKEDSTLIPATLSMLGFVYDALLNSNDNYGAWIINDIRQKYGYMLSQGATSFWETLEGVTIEDYSNSLCHGWSAIPVYYYNIIKRGEEI